MYRKMRKSDLKTASEKRTGRPVKARRFAKDDMKAFEDAMDAFMTKKRDQLLGPEGNLGALQGKPGPPAKKNKKNGAKEVPALGDIGLEDIPRGNGEQQEVCKEGTAQRR